MSEKKRKSKSDTTDGGDKEEHPTEKDKFNQLHNRVVWFDLPASDLERAAEFYRAMLNIKVDVVSMGPEHSMAVFEHGQGNGGALVLRPDEVARRDTGPLLYLNAEGRIRDAVKQASAHGGKVIEDVASLGPHGFRAIVRDSEGNRVGLHSTIDK
jgi:predicted enzyme related to lactoylglutathione lyase